MLQRLFWLLTLTLFYSADAFALDVVTSSTSQDFMLFLGGLAFLLYGLKQTTTAVRAFSGDQLRLTLASITKNRFMSLISGFMVTLMTQSSTATIAMVISLVSARFLTLVQAMGIVLGANIGTTITVQLIAFRLSDYALYAIGIGFLLRTLMQNERLQNLGAVIMALGFIFFGLFLVSESAANLKNQGHLESITFYLSSPTWALVSTALLTALLQSSAAAIGLVIALASQGTIDMQTAFFCVLGANLGNCSSAILVSLDKSAEARRVALMHVCTNIATVLVTIILMMGALNAVTQHPANLLGFDLSLSPERRIANFHTAYNIFMALLFLPLLTPAQKLLNRVFTDKPRKEMFKPQYIDGNFLSTPDIALDAFHKEISVFAGEVNDMLKEAMPLVISGTDSKLRKIRNQEKRVDSHYRQLLDYMSRLSREDLTEKQTQEQIHCITLVNHLENISDLIGDDLYSVGIKRNKRDVVVSKQTQQQLNIMADRVEHAISLTTSAVCERNLTHARRVMRMKKDINHQMHVAEQHQYSRLGAHDRNRVETYSVEMDILEVLQRIYFHCRKIAEEVLAYYRTEEATPPLATQPEGEEAPIQPKRKGKKQRKNKGSIFNKEIWEDPTV